jgi:hypothetical protein
MYENLPSPKHKLCRDPAYINEAIKALQAAQQQRLVPPRMQNLDEDTQKLIDEHLKRKCDCAANYKEYYLTEHHDYWHSERGETCDCAELTEQDCLDSSESECKKAVADIRRNARRGMPLLYVPVLDDHAIKLYGAYANRNLKMTDELKTRLEIIEDIVVEAIVNRTFAFEEKPEHLWRRPTLEGQGWTLFEVTPPGRRVNTKGNSEALSGGTPAPAEWREIFDEKLSIGTEGQGREINSFDRVVKVDKETWHTEKMTKLWLQEYLAEKPPGRDRESARADFARLFELKSLEKRQKNRV